LELELWELEQSEPVQSEMGQWEPEPCWELELPSKVRLSWACGRERTQVSKASMSKARPGQGRTRQGRHHGAHKKANEVPQHHKKHMATTMESLLHMM
jgi:hypothetical protein